MNKKDRDSLTITSPMPKSLLDSIRQIEKKNKISEELFRKYRKRKLYESR